MAKGAFAEKLAKEIRRKTHRPPNRRNQHILWDTIDSIRSNSASVNGRALEVATMCSKCSTFLVPGIATETCGWCRTNWSAA